MTEEQIKAVEEFAERIKNYYRHYHGSIPSGMIVYFIDQAVKEVKNA